MAESTDWWQKKLDDTIGHAQKVFEKEVDRLQKQVENTNSAEAHHIQHLENVIAHEADRVDRAYGRIAKRKEKGASDEPVQPADEHIERDVKAAAHHVIDGFEDIELDEESLGYKVEVDAEKVA